MTVLAALTAALTTAGVPFKAVSVGDDNDRTTWRVQFSEDATPEDRAAAAALIANLNPAAPRVRLVSRYEFLTRLSVAEDTALEAFSMNPATPLQQAAALRVLRRRFEAAAYVDLDRQEVVDGLASIKTILRALGVWASDAIADARIAQIRGLA